MQHKRQNRRLIVFTYCSLIFICLLITSLCFVLVIIISHVTLSHGAQASIGMGFVACHLSVYLSVCRSVCLSGVLWKNGQLNLDAVWGDGSSGYKDEAGTWGWRLPHSMGQFWGGCGHPIVSSGDFVA